MRRFPRLNDLSVVTNDPEAMALLRDKRLRMIFYLNGLDQVTDVGERALELIRTNRQS